MGGQDGGGGGGGTKKSKKKKKINDRIKNWNDQGEREVVEKIPSFMGWGYGYQLEISGRNHFTC